VATNIWSHAPRWTRPLLALYKLRMLSPEQGGQYIVHMATSPELEGQTGGYYDLNRPSRPGGIARDPALPGKLWDVSATLVGLLAGSP
jgi:hypothetical protein